MERCRSIEGGSARDVSENEIFGKAFHFGRVPFGEEPEYDRNSENKTRHSGEKNQVLEIEGKFGWSKPCTDEAGNGHVDHIKVERNGVIIVRHDGTLGDPACGCGLGSGE
ncbi:hypothetical protein GCM10023212_35070 [Luteolibacter yonseiensis]